MRLKATWSLLLLLLVSVQAFAAACDVRCGTMAIMDASSHMSGMNHCHGMVSRSLAGSTAVTVLATSQPCASHICKSGWVFLQSPVAYELGASSLPVSAHSHTVT